MVLPDKSGMKIIVIYRGPSQRSFQQSLVPNVLVMVVVVEKIIKMWNINDDKDGRTTTAMLC